ncbi:MAG TPA: hypothetical protein VGS19_26600 [Streptosporangiaceae bacterium]|nr:hypothetical protein [Streptosporangiaceae bacterium]
MTRPVVPPAPPPNALFAEMLHAARELLAVRSPLDAELMVSELLGTWWGERAGRPVGKGNDLEELVGEGLVAYAAGHQSAPALALLCGVACLGTQRQAALAEKAALALLEKDIPRPPWADQVGAVEAAECYINSDPYGDGDEVVCLFSYAGAEPHALVMTVDYNTQGALRDGWVTSQVDTLLERCRQPRDTAFGAASPPEVRQLLSSALGITDSAAEPPVTPSFAAYHAFIRARIRALPPGRPARVPDVRSRRSARPPVGPEPASGWLGVQARQRAWTGDRRAMLVVEFLASDDAEGLSDRQAASRCTDHIINYGCEQDFGRPLRMSPAKAERFLLTWLPQKIMLTKAEQHAMPHVLAAWTRWAGVRTGLPEPLAEETLDAVIGAMETFTKVYRDPASFGLDSRLVARLLPDADLEALPRRAFAFPVLRGTFDGVDLATLDPTQPQAQRTLLAADHNDANGRPTSEQHLQRHVVLSDRLWRGDPPELWEAAQRMLDRGQDRHAVQHTLMYVIRDAGDDPAKLAEELAKLS